MAPARCRCAGRGGERAARLRRALDQFKGGNYAAAIASFTAFVKTYPKSPLAPSAQYWIGNAQFAQKDYRAAIASQRQLIAAYPDSQKVPDALLNIATSQFELGDGAAVAPHARGADREVPAVRGRGQGAAAPRHPLSGSCVAALPPRAMPNAGRTADARRCRRDRRRKPPMPAPSFAARLVAWQRAHGRHDLPWQSTRDAYRIWLSEIMLQQTQVATVIPYYERFLAAFPDVRALAAAPLDRVLEHWSGLGYYRRAHHLHAAARRSSRGMAALFPRDVARDRDAAGHRPLDRGGDRGVRVRRARGDPRRQRQARARAPSRHRRLSRRAEGRGAAVGASRRRCCPRATSRPTRRR